VSLRIPSAFGLATLLLVAPATRAADLTSQVDAAFSAFGPTTPGCAVGVALDGVTTLTRGFGMADLERDVPIGPDTIFEAGSVTKQFTAAAVLMLARDGKLSLDDAARRYVPEVPDYGMPLTIRHLLNHTSGLRDWGALEGVAGWPRTTRVNTHAHVLEVVKRQRALNFTPGTHWSYSNTGYNLAAIIVQRVSGQSLADFTRARIFEPLGMTRTSWRDDHTRIVKGRAQAYDLVDGVFHLEMPFENVHGNGGLLTTVGDLLAWTSSIAAGKIGGPGFLAEMEKAVSFSGDPTRGYGLGLMMDTRRGVRQLDHSGSTAGYRAHLATYPDPRVSVAVLCNGSNGGATTRAYQVADLYLGERTSLAPPPAVTHTLTSEETARVEGLYRSTLSGAFVSFIHDKNGVRVEGGGALLAQSPTRFLTPGGQSWEFEGDRARYTDRYDVVPYVRVAPVTPSAADLAEFVGNYASSEAGLTLGVIADGDALIVTRTPDTRMRLRPVYKDAFYADQLGVIVFRRDAGGKVVALSVSQERIWDLRFEKK